MKQGVKRWLRRAGVAVASLVLVLFAGVAIVLGTHGGSRWALGQLPRFVPGELQIGDSRGTFLGGLQIAQLSYVYGKVEVTAERLLLQVDWLRSSLDRLVLRRLTADEIAYRSLAPADPQPRPLRVSMPALPIRIGIDSVSIRTLRIADLAASDVVATNPGMRGDRISADSAAATYSGVTVNLGQPDMRLAGDVPLSTDIAWQQVDGPWSGTGRVDGSLAEVGFEHELSGPYPARAQGSLFLLDRIEPEIDAVVRFEEWSFASLTASGGEVHIAGTRNGYRAALDLALSDERTLAADLPPLSITGEVEGNLQELTALALTANSLAGQAAATGTLRWQPAFATALDVRARQVDPSRFGVLAEGRLDADLRFDATATNEFTLQVDALTGRYNNEPLRAQGRLSRDQDRWSCAACEASLGPNRLFTDGMASPASLSARISVDAPQVALLWPAISGALSADATLRGSIESPVLSGTASGRQLSWQEWTASSFSVSSRASSRQKVDLEVSVADLGRDDRNFGSGTAQLAGGTEALDAALAWDTGNIEAAAKAVLAIGAAGLRADIRSASVTEPFGGTWQLVGPMAFSVNPQSLSAGPHAWENGAARLNVPQFGITAGELGVEAELVGMPLATLNLVLPENIRLSGTVDAQLDLGQQEGARIGELRWTQRDTIVRLTPPRDEAIDIQVPVASAGFRLAGKGIEGQAQLEIEPGVRGSLDLALDEFSADANIMARLRFGGSEWDWIPAFFPEIDNFRGNLVADVSASGSLAAPRLQGELRWEAGQLAVPALNVPLEDIQVTIVGSSAGSATVTGSASAGGGKLALDGRFSDLMRDERSFTLRLSGQGATLLNWPDYQLAASPNLVFAGDARGIRASGEVSVDRAAISVRELPEESVSPSADVTVIGREVQAQSGLPVSGNVRLLLNENVHISAFGLDTDVQGALRFSIAKNREPAAEGELKLVNGIFGAYGQRLTIEEGTLTFNGPLDDPLIFVRAVRVIEDVSGTVKAGIELRGRAQNITSSVFSTPAMSEADALSYLILGRPLEQATTADGNMLAGTAYALGLRQATVITGQIGQSLGLDQLAVSGSNQSTTSLVAGKQVNSRLYVRYAYGVFTQIGNLLLRYRLSKRLTIEAGTGESESMDILYIVETP